MQLENRIADALDAAGISTGDTVFVHSSVRGLVLSLLAEGRRDADLVKAAGGLLHGGLAQCVGDKGTIAAPAFFYEYGRYGTPFNAATSTPDKSLGGHSAWMLKAPGMRRSLCPPVSIMAQGEHAPDICDTGSGFGFGSLSPWQKLVDLDAKMLFWECSPRMMTFAHHVEVLAGVPHIYNKVYDAPVTGLNEAFEGPVISAVRYLDEEYKILYELADFTEAANEAGIIRTTQMGALTANVLRFRDCEKLMLEKLRNDPYYLLVEPPKFTPGKIPFDGSAGTLNPELAYQHDK